MFSLATTKRALRSLVCLVASVLGLVPLALAQSSASPVPKGLSAADWSSIRAAYETARHRAFAVDGGYRARNPGQQWSTRFDGRGFTVEPDGGDWSWGLELVAYGFEGQERAIRGPSDVTAEGQRVAYDWDAALTEWYVNDTRGLEHGYTVHRRPDGCGDGPLTFTLAVRGGLAPSVQQNGRGVVFASDGGASLTYAGLTVFDANGTELPARFDRVADGVALSIDERGARYPLTIDPIAQQAYLKASNTGSGDRFGIAVSVSGDTVVVGARDEDSSATGVNGDGSNNFAGNSGAAYVFVRSGTSWSQQAYLKASNTGAGDWFGFSVSVSGDTIVVGARSEDSAATGVNGNQMDNSLNAAGAAYVFVRNGTSWSQQAYLKASNTEASDIFATSVSVSGDTIVVGAWGEDSGAAGVNGNQFDNSVPGSGAAYVFVRNGTSWSQQAYLKASNPGGSDYFGQGVSVSGDTIVVGAWSEDSAATGVNGNQTDNSAANAGAAYVFSRSGSTWSQQAYLKASNSGGGDSFGLGVSVSGETVMVGAWGEDSGSTGVNGDQNDNSVGGSGAAYVFVRNGSAWSQQAYLKASNTSAGDRFGHSVSVSGDTAVVGAVFENGSATGVNGDQSDNSAGGSGAAYVFVRNAGSWSQQAYLKASNTGSGDNFGISVSVSGDTVVTGAWQEDSNATSVNGDGGNNSASNGGAAYVFYIRPDSYGCETAAAGYGAPTLEITSGAPRIDTTFDLTIQNPSPTAAAAALGFELFPAPVLAPQDSLAVFGFCWNLPLPFNGAFVPIPTSTVLSLTLPNAPGMFGCELAWQVLAIDPASTSTGLAITASRGLTMQIGM